MMASKDREKISVNTRTARIIRTRRKRRQQKQGNTSYFLRRLLVIGIILLAAVVLTLLTGVGGAVGVYAYYARELPPPSQIESAQDDAFQTTVLYDRTGQYVLYEIVPTLGGDRQWASIYDVPQYFLDATVAIEDASFYTNPGFDLRGIVRAMWTNLNGGTVQGGSTITQQLVRNVLLTEEERAERTFDRKSKEIILASEISRLYSKEQILEWYINTNFYGNLAYGIEAAARIYFDKPAHELTLGEAAMLAAIPQFPRQNPIDNPDSARLRQQLVLQRMVNLGYITQEQMSEALAQPIILGRYSERFDITAPHFSLYARTEAETILNQLGLDGSYLVSRGGLRIYTTLDYDLQEQLECVSRTEVMRLDGAAQDFVHNTHSGGPCTAASYLPPLPADMQGVERHVTNAAGVMLKADTSEIVAMIGSVDFWNKGIDGNFNVATAERQPGSVFKPIVYMTAFLNPIDNGTTIVTPAMMTTDVRMEFNNGGPEPYVPQNIDLVYHGPVSIRDALANSFNVPAVQVLNWVGLSKVIQTAHRLGINSLDEGINAYGLSLALGSGETTLLDMTYVYNVFNNLGYATGMPVHASVARPGYRQLNPTSILRIEDAEGKILWEYSEGKGTFDRRLIIPQGMAYIMTDILSDEEARLQAFAPGNPLELSRPAAAKTGTTDDNRDSVTVGYTPQYTTGIWVGNNDNTSMTDVTGMTGAAPIWHAIMEYAHANLEVKVWERPSTVVEQTVCQWSGLLPTQNCPQVPRELFFVDTVNGIDYRPQRTDNLWYRLPIDVCTNTRANNTTPSQCVEERIFFNFDVTPELRQWAEENVTELLPPQAESVVIEGSQFSPIAFVAPRFPDKVSGQVEIYGNTRMDNFAYYQLGFGQGNEPSSFIQIGQNGAESGFNQLLGVWDTTQQPDGVYTLQLQVVNGENRVETAYTRITVDNTPPEIRLIEPPPAGTYYADTDIIVNFQAEVFDAGDIDRVEFYVAASPDEQDDDEEEDTQPEVGGILIGESTAFPYTLPWAIEEFGVKTFWAVAYDRAGNRAESLRVVITLEEEAP